MVGNVSASKKSALLRWASRFSSPVLTVATGISASISERVGSVGSRRSLPLIPENFPFTLEIIMCLTLNSAAEWAGSMFQVVTAAGVAVVVAMGWLLSAVLDAAS